MEYSFASGEIFLSIAQSEYQNELNRTSVIDSKIAIALPIIATYFFLAVQFSSFKTLFSQTIDTKTVISGIVSVCIPLSYLFALVTAGIALLYMFRAISTHTYQTIDVRQFNEAKQMSLPKLEFSAALATIYIRATERNRLQNDTRVHKYMSGWLSAIISLIMFVFHVVLSK